MTKTSEELWQLFVSNKHEQVLTEASAKLSDNVDFLHISGMSLVKVNRGNEGAALLRAAAVIRPDYPHLFANASVAFIEKNALLEAEAFARLGLSHHPENAELHFMLGNALMGKHEYAEAAEHQLKAITIEPGKTNARLNLGNCLRHSKRHKEAEDTYRTVLAMDPNNQDGLVNLGGLLAEMGKEQEAIPLLRKALSFGDHASGDVVLAFILLGLGEYAEGWKKYRRRWEADITKPDRALYERPFAKDLESVKGKSVLAVHEQGLGDSLQFSRYVNLLKNEAKKVELIVPESLVSLFQYSYPDIKVVSNRKDADPDRVYEIPLLDLPDMFGTTLENIPNKIPYLSVPNQLIAKHNLGVKDKMRVGIVWAGHKRENPLLAMVDERRSMRLSDFIPLFEIPDIEWHSLQLGEPEKQITHEYNLKLPLKSDFSFADTAAVIKQLDLVITVDTSVAHLSGGLGIPTWVLSRHDACWRWLKNRTDSPWYPGMTIFTQPKQGDWESVIRSVKTELTHRVHKDRD